MNASRTGRGLAAIGIFLPCAAIISNPWILSNTIWPAPRMAAGAAATLWIVSAAALGGSALVIRRALRQPARQRRRAIFAAAAAYASLGVGLIGLEVICRVFFPLPRSGDTDSPKAAIYGWAYGPRQRQVTADPETGELYENRANWDGWRDVDHPAEDTRPRIILLGDSQVFGRGLPFDKIPGRLLQERLPQYQIRSVGVEGWSNDQQLLYLHEEGFALKPAAVILLFTVNNDSLGNISRTILAGTAPKPFYTLKDGELVFHPCEAERIARVRRLAGRLESVRRMRRSLASWIRTTGGDPAIALPNRIFFSSALVPVTADECVSLIYAKDWDAEIQAGWDLTLRLLEKMAAECAARGVEFMIYPNRQPTGPTSETRRFADGVTREVTLAKPYDLLKGFCREKNIPYIEETPELIQGNAANLTRFRGDCHLNETGSRLTADLLAAAVEARMGSGLERGGGSDKVLGNDRNPSGEAMP